MKTTFKKLAGILLCLVLCFGAVACGPKSGGNKPSNDDYVADLTVDPNISATLKIGFYGTTDEDDDHFRELEQAFQLRYPNVNIQMVKYGSTSYYQDLMQAYQTGTMPDIIQTNATECFPLIENGLLLDMDKYIQLENASYAQNKALYPEFYEYETFEDQFYNSLWK